MSICSTHSSGVAPERDGVDERVEVHDDELERLDAELVELLAVVLEPQVGEDAGVHARVQRLDPAVEALGEAGELLDLGHRDAGGGDLAGGRAGGDELDARGVQAAGELLEPGLVVDADQRAADRPRSSVGGVLTGSWTFLPVTVRQPWCDAERADDVDEQLALDDLDALVQRGLVVVVADRRRPPGR